MSVIRFNLPSDPAKYVDLKGTWNYGDTKAAAKAKAAAANETAGALDGSDVILERFVVGCNVTEEAPSPETFDNLSEGDVLAIVKKCINLRPKAPPVPNP